MHILSLIFSPSFFLLHFTDTPLGLVCGRHSHVQCIMPLLSGGAHIDFRGKDGLTPLHRAAIGGNSQAVKVQGPIQSGSQWSLSWKIYAILGWNFNNSGMFSKPFSLVFCKTKSCIWSHAVPFDMQYVLVVSQHLYGMNWLLSVHRDKCCMWPLGMNWFKFLETP